jgi:hypothetical protein
MSFSHPYHSVLLTCGIQKLNFATKETVPQLLHTGKEGPNPKHAALVQQVPAQPAPAQLVLVPAQPALAQPAQAHLAVAQPIQTDCVMHGSCHGGMHGHSYQYMHMPPYHVLYYLRSPSRQKCRYSEEDSSSDCD